MSDHPPGVTLPPGAGGLPSCPDGVGTPAVAMVCGNAYSIENDPFAEEYGHTKILAIDGFRGEIVDGMVVYYEDNPCDSDESDWEDLYDVAGRQYVDDYDFDVPDGMDLMVFERGEKPSGSEMMDMKKTDPTLVCQTDYFECSGSQVAHWEYLSVGECRQCKGFRVCRCCFPD